MTPEEAIEIIDLYCGHVYKPKKTKEAFDMAISSLKEIQQYRKIGTVEECRVAVEKQKAKKPIPINHQNYADKIVNVDFLDDAYICPNCKTVLRSGSCCNRCGQKLDWSDEE